MRLLPGIDVSQFFFSPPSHQDGNCELSEGTWKINLLLKGPPVRCVLGEGKVRLASIVLPFGNQAASFQEWFLWRWHQPETHGPCSRQTVEHVLKAHVFLCE